MKKYIFIGMITLLLTACFASENNQNNESSKDSSNDHLPEKLQQYYKQSHLKSGFSRLLEPNINETYWVLKIFKLLDKEVPEKESIKNWVNDIKIEKIIATGNKKNMRSYSESQLIKILYIKNSLDIKIDKENLSTIINFINNGEHKIELSNGSIANSNLIKLSNSIKNKDFISFNPKDLLKKGSEMNNLYYLYLYTLLDFQINKSEIESINIVGNSKTLTPLKLNSLYQLKVIYNKNSIDFNQKVGKGEINKLINSYVYKRNKLSSQYLYQFLYVFKNRIETQDIDRLIDFLSGMKQRNGWTSPSATINLVDTYQGINVASFHNSLDAIINKKGLHRYLNETLNKVMNNISDYYVYLPMLAESFNKVGTNKEVSKISNYITSELKKELKKTKPNLEYVLILIDSGISLELSSKLNIIVNKNDLKVINDFIRPLKDKNSVRYVYYSSLINKICSNNGGSLQDNIKGNFKYKENEDSTENLQRILLALKINELNESNIINVNNNKLKNFLEKELLESDKLMKMSIISECLNLLKND